MMSNTTSFSEQERMDKKMFHRRNDSSELDVFEAARYFSGTNEISGENLNLTHKFMIRQQSCKQGGRMSLDMPNVRNSIPSQSTMEKLMREKKYKKPSSPGGKLASFLNSLFNQTSSTKKKSKSAKTQSVTDEDESPGGRRKRRSSISHFRSTGNNNISIVSDTKSIYSTSSSGFRTPPLYNSHTPPTTKTSYKDLRSYSDHKPVLITTNLSKQVQTINEKIKEMVFDETNGSKGENIQDFGWLHENFKFKNGVNSEKNKDFRYGVFEKGRIWGSTDHDQKYEDDDGGDSDTSSDLFELTNCDLGYYSCGLPVYETTHMDSIKKGAPISNGPI